jgi:hypothetical protein
MSSSSNASDVSGQRLPRAVESPASLREYRRQRQHLYPLDDYLSARQAGGTIKTYCGLDTTVAVGDPVEVADADGLDAEDCVSCVDVWRGSEVVRL